MFKSIIPCLIFVIISVIVIYITFLSLTKIHKNHNKLKLKMEYYIKCLFNIAISVGFYTCLIYFKQIYKDIHFPSISNIILYLLLTDTFYYWTHRAIHRIPFLKQWFHLTHHEAVHLVPMDIFYTDITENVIYLCIVGFIPLFFIPVNMIDYLIINMVVIYHASYTHYEKKTNFILPLFIDSNYHKRHHQIGKGNYSVLFPIWDDYMGTRIKHKKSK